MQNNFINTFCEMKFAPEGARKWGFPVIVSKMKAGLPRNYLKCFFIDFRKSTPSQNRQRIVHCHSSKY